MPQGLDLASAAAGRVVRSAVPATSLCIFGCVIISARWDSVTWGCSYTFSHKGFNIVVYSSFSSGGSGYCFFERPGFKCQMWIKNSRAYIWKKIHWTIWRKVINIQTSKQCAAPLLCSAFYILCNILGLHISRWIYFNANLQEFKFLRVTSGDLSAEWLNEVYRFFEVFLKTFRIYGIDSAVSRKNFPIRFSTIL